MVGNRRHISKEVKEIIVRLTHNFTAKETAGILEVSERTVRRVRHLAMTTGRVVSIPLEVGRRRVITGLDAAYLESCIEHTPDLFLRELQERLYRARDIYVNISTISDTLHRRGFTRKKVTREASERNEELRDAYRRRIAENYRPDQLVFLDESACNRITARRSMAWAPVGTRARRRDCFIRGQRYSILPAISLDGLLFLLVLNRPFKAVDFNDFVDGLLDMMNPFPGPNSVIIMDNASIHKSQLLEPMVRARGMRIEYLSAYSPDFNPIEEAFSVAKAWIRGNRDYALGELTGREGDPYAMIWEAIAHSVTRENCRGWFRDCGYL